MEQAPDGFTEKSQFPSEKCRYRLLTRYNGVIQWKLENAKKKKKKFQPKSPVSRKLFFN